MNKYHAVYKCALCETLLLYGDSHEVPYDALLVLIGKVIKNQQFAGNPYLYEAPLQIPHKCKDGNCGIAYFAGFRKQECDKQ